MRIRRRKPGGAPSLRIPLTVALTLALAAPIATGLPADAVEQPAPSTQSPQNTSGEARALAEAAESGDQVEVLAQRTETSQVFANPDGSFTQDTYAVPQWVRKDNKLVTIDPDLKATADGTLVTKATEVGLRFSGGGDGPLVTIIRDGRSMSWSWPKPLPKPEISGNTATYPEVFKDVDLKLRAGAGGFSQLLVVKTAEAAANPELQNLDFALGTDGVEASADEHGNLKAVNPAGQVIFTAPTPRMWDSSEPTTSLAAAFSAAEPPTDEFEPGHGAQEAAMPLDVADGALTLKPDQDLLTGADTTYPVYIDPAVSGSREAWAIAYKKYPSATFYNGAGWVNLDGSKGTTVARIGYENVTDGTARSFFRMDSNNLWNTDKVVSRSVFQVKNSWSWSCTDRTAEVWLTGAISSSTSWSNQPSWSRELDSVNDSKGYSSSCPAGNLAFDVTSAAKESITKKWNNITLGMRASAETDVYAWKKFDAKTAVLSTTYNTRPSAASGLDTSPSTKNAQGCGDTAPYGLIGNTDIYLTAVGSDKDGGSVNVRFRLWATGHHPNDDPNGVMIVDSTAVVPSGTRARVKVTKAQLQPHLATANGNFSWKAQTNDGSLYADWTPATGSPGCRFVFDPNRPSTPPGVTSSQFPDGSNGWPSQTGAVRTEGTFAFTAGGVSDVTKYEYWSDWDSTRRTATPGVAGGSVSVKLTPTVAGANQLYVRSLDKAGNYSDTTTYLFYANGIATPDKPGDLNGDGNADLWAVDQAGTLFPFFGAGDGNFAKAAFRSTALDLTGAGVTHRGDWTDDGYEDLIALRNDSTLGAKRLWMHPNNGFGYACSACENGPERKELTTYDPANNHWSNADQVLAIGDVDGPLDTDGDGTIDAPGYPDLLVKQGDLLWLYYGAPDNRLDSYRDPILIGPDNWAKATLIAPGNAWGDERVDLVSRNTETGDLYLFAGTGPDGDGLADQSTKLKTGSGFTAATHPLIASPGDADHDGYPDLVAVASTGHLWFFPRLTEGDLPFRDLGDGWTGYQSLS